MHQRLTIELPTDTPPILSVVIHAEEEFDWDKAHDRNATRVTHMRSIDRIQRLFEEYGIVPNYVVDYPVASQEEGYGPLKPYVEDGKALIGAHLHPWVSPPHEESVTRRNTYPGNLPAALEREKLRLLTERIAASFGVRPTTYLAGRYGFGPNTAAALEDLGYEVDISPAPPIDFSSDGGPDYSGYSSHPFWFDGRRKLLGLPSTGAYVGLLRRADTPLYQLMTAPALRFAHLPGIFSRLRLMERIRLSPEDYTEPEMRRLTRSLLAQGLRVFVFGFHSPSLEPGHTPYVRNAAELEDFLTKCRRYFDFFLGELQGKAMHPVEIKSLLERQGARRRPDARFDE
jgi:hypothetical protein